MKQCIYCAEQIQDAAVVCRFCGGDLTSGKGKASPPPSPARRPQGPARISTPRGAFTVGRGFLGCTGLVLLGGLGFCALVASNARHLAEVAPPPKSAASASTLPTLPPKETPKAERDVAVDFNWQKGGFGSIALLDIKLVNKSKTFTYTNLHYRTNYSAESGTRLRTNRGEFNIVLKPGETRWLKGFNDGFVPQQTDKCSITIYGSDSELGVR